MASRHVSIAEALKDYINTQTFSINFTASRKYIPWNQIKDIKQLTVIVRPTKIISSALTRKASQYDRFMDIGFLQKIDVATNDDADDLMALCEEVEHRIQHVSQAGALWKANEILSPYHEESLNDNSVFLSVIQVNYYETA